MRRRFGCFLVFVIFAPLVFGQPAAQNEPDWQPFQPQNEEFRLEIPVELKLRGNASRMYFGSIKGTWLYVFSDPVKSQAYYAEVKKHVDSLGEQQKIEPAQLSPQLMSFGDKFGYWQKLVVLRTDARVYIVQTVSRTEDDEIATRFIRSFAIGETPVVAAGTDSKKPNPHDAAAPLTSQGAGMGGGQGSGSGTGTGTGSGVGSDPPAPKPAEGQTTALRILAKSPPGYTDLGRFYAITGSVLLRITFRDSGEIGSVTPVTTLPFGLTLRAIDAAKSIRFEPAYRDGRPISTTKAVEYSFAIY